MTLASEAGYGTRLLTVGDTIVTHRNGLEHGAPAPIAAPAARPSRQAIPHHPFDARRWSREHWVLASVFGTLGVLVMAIVPGFSQATRSQPEHVALTTTELALPPLRAPVAADPGEAWQVVRVEPGQTLGAMSFSDWPAATRHNDAEGLTYIGNGMLVVAEERLQDAFQFSYVAGSSVNLANAPSVSISDSEYGNNGLEGLSYDPRNGSFVSVKQQSPMQILGGTLDFSTGVSTMTALFDPALLGLSSFSDIQTLSPISALAGTAAADNLLVLSLTSNTLLEVTRTGQILSSLNLAGITSQAIEGVTVDNLGNLYLVAEDSGTGASRLFVLAAPVPEPETYAMLLAGLGLLGGAVARRRQGITPPAKRG